MFYEMIKIGQTQDNILLQFYHLTCLKQKKLLQNILLSTPTVTKHCVCNAISHDLVTQ